MKLGRFDHVNVRTANVPQMIAWYESVLGMRSGPRPPFSFPGAWLYVGDHPSVHLVGVATPPAVTETRLEHFAFQASGLKEFIQRLKAGGHGYDLGVVPDFGIIQINVWDPDGNHIHIDFAPAEAETIKGDEDFKDIVLY
jgi:catechol 2,3-dioxygenase-like lactoylglutathione lyase family enzyme